MGRLGWILGSLAVGCTAPNPEFGDGNGTTGPSTTASSDPTAPSSDGVTSDNPPVETTRGDDGSSSSGRETAEGDSTGNVSVDAGRECASESTEISMLLTQDGDPLDECVPPVPTHGAVVGYANGVLSFRGCATCEECQLGTEYGLQLGGMALPPVFANGDCIAISVQIEEAECALRSLSIARRLPDPETWEPLVLVAHDSFVVKDARPLGDLMVGWAERICAGDGCETAGEHTLAFGNASYGASDSASGVPLFESAFSFDLAVKSAGIDARCETQIAWMASRHPPG